MGKIITSRATFRSKSSTMRNAKPRPTLALRQETFFSPLAKGGIQGGLDQSNASVHKKNLPQAPPLQGGEEECNHRDKTGNRLSDVHGRGNHTVAQGDYWHGLAFEPTIVSDEPRRGFGSGERSPIIVACIGWRAIMICVRFGDRDLARLDAR